MYILLCSVCTLCEMRDDRRPLARRKRLCRSCWCLQRAAARAQARLDCDRQADRSSLFESIFSLSLPLSLALPLSLSPSLSLFARSLVCLGEKFPTLLNAHSAYVRICVAP